MQDLALVGVAHRVEHLHEQPDTRWRIESAGIAPGDQRLALHVLHRDVGRAGGIDADIVKACDVRGFKRGEDAALARKSFRYLRRHIAQMRDLQRDLALECAISAVRQPHLGHAARTKRPQQFVGAEPFARVAVDPPAVRGAGCLDARHAIQRPADCAGRVVRQQALTHGLQQRLVLFGQRIEPDAPLLRRQCHGLVQQLAETHHFPLRQAHAAPSPTPLPPAASAWPSATAAAPCVR